VLPLTIFGTIYSIVGIADAMARLTGIPGVAIVTAGPGLTNTITAVKVASVDAIVDRTSPNLGVLSMLGYRTLN
jgi:endonuclease III